MPGAGLIQQQSDVSDFLVQRLVAIDTGTADSSAAPTAFVPRKRHADIPGPGADCADIDPGSASVSGSSPSSAPVKVLGYPTKSAAQSCNTTRRRVIRPWQLWSPECVSARPGMPDAGFIAPAPMPSWL